METGVSLSPRCQIMPPSAVRSAASRQSSAGSATRSDGVLGLGNAPVATRYDKRRYVHFGTATAAALTISLRT